MAVDPRSLAPRHRDVMMYARRHVYILFKIVITSRYFAVLTRVCVCLYPPPPIPCSLSCLTNRSFHRRHYLSNISYHYSLVLLYFVAVLFLSHLSRFSLKGEINPFFSSFFLILCVDRDLGVEDVDETDVCI